MFLSNRNRNGKYVYVGWNSIIQCYFRCLVMAVCFYLEFQCAAVEKKGNNLTQEKHRIWDKRICHTFSYTILVYIMYKPVILVKFMYERKVFVEYLRQLFCQTKPNLLHKKFTSILVERSYNSVALFYSSLILFVRANIVFEHPPPINSP